MSIKSFVLIGSALLASVAFAQSEAPSLGTVRNVEGVVTDTDGASVTSTAPGEAIHDGERFVTSSSGSVTLQLNNGCTITMQPNQAVTIDKRMTCRELIAAVEPVGGSSLASGRFAAAGSPGLGALAVGGLILAGYGVHRAFDKDDDRKREKDPDLSGR